jgi:8-oxo-dGTP pyrophosphatase MutT (NUDIX family)
VSPGLTLVVDREMPPLDPETDRAVAAHWATARAGRALFNGRVFSADVITPERLTGHWTEYRRVVAQMAEPPLFATLRVRSLAVCGVLCCPDGIVLGRREARSIYQPGLWQLPPAGSVDHGAARPGGADWRQAILAELQEELGIPPEAATSLLPFCLVQHPTGVLDLGIRIDTAMGATEIMARHVALGDGEYDALRILPSDRLLATIQPDRLVPSAYRFLRNLPPDPTR